MTPRTVAGVYQITSGSGLYSVYATFPDSFHGQIVWDTGTALSPPAYAFEQYNFEENNPTVTDVTPLVTAINNMSSSIQFLVDAEGGRWRILNNQMVFYKSDNSTEIMRFDLFDDQGNPSSDAVFERRRV